MSNRIEYVPRDPRTGEGGHCRYVGRSRDRALMVARYNERMAKHGDDARARRECVAERWRSDGFSHEVASRIAADDFEGALHVLAHECPLKEGEWIALLMEAQQMVVTRNRR